MSPISLVSSVCHLIRLLTAASSELISQRVVHPIFVVTVRDGGVNHGANVLGQAEKSRKCATAT